MSKKKGTLKTIKNKPSLKHIINVVWFQNVLFSDLMLRNRLLKILHASVGVLSITEFRMKESLQKQAGNFKIRYNRLEPAIQMSFSITIRACFQ